MRTTGSDGGSVTRLCAVLHGSERRQQILALLAGQLTYGEIGRELMISENTVKSHVQRMMAFAGVDRRRLLADLAKRQGLIDMTPSPPEWIGCDCPPPKGSARPRSRAVHAPAPPTP